MKVVVEGSPLSLKREALGLEMSGPEPLLGFGEVGIMSMHIHTRKASLLPAIPHSNSTYSVPKHVR